MAAPIAEDQHFSGAYRPHPDATGLRSHWNPVGVSVLGQEQQPLTLPEHQALGHYFPTRWMIVSTQTSSSLAQA